MSAADDVLLSVGQISLLQEAAQQAAEHDQALWTSLQGCGSCDANNY